MYVNTACLGRGHTETSHFGLVIACAQLACVLPVERSHQTPCAKLGWLVFLPNFEYLETHQRSREIGKQNSGDLQLVFSFDEEVKIKNNNKKQKKPGS